MRIKSYLRILPKALTCVLLSASFAIGDSVEDQQTHLNQPVDLLLSLFDSTMSTNPITRLYACDDLIAAATDDPAAFERLANLKPMEFQTLLNEIGVFRCCGVDLGLIFNEHIIDNVGTWLRAAADSAGGGLELVGKIGDRMCSRMALDSCMDSVLSSVSESQVGFVMALLESSDGEKPWSYAPKLLSLMALSPRAVISHFSNDNTHIDHAAVLIAHLDSDFNSNLPLAVLTKTIKAARLSLNSIPLDGEDRRISLWLNRALNEWTAAHPEPDVITGVLQAALDSPDLESFNHPSLPNREELCISGRGLSDDVKLHWHSQPVTIANEWPVECENRLEVDELQLYPNSAYLLLRYRRQGMYAEFWLHADGPNWQIDSTRVLQL